MKGIILLFCLFLTISSCNNNSTDNTNRIDTAAIKAQCLAEAKPAYLAASKLISDVRSEIAVGNDNGAIMLYNTTLGLEMGHLDDIDDIKIKLDSSGEKYIMYKWYKAAGAIATAKAAEHKFIIEQIKADTIK